MLYSQALEHEGKKTALRLESLALRDVLMEAAPVAHEGSILKIFLPLTECAHPRRALFPLDGARRHMHEAPTPAISLRSHAALDGDWMCVKHVCLIVIELLS